MSYTHTLGATAPSIHAAPLPTMTAEQAAASRAAHEAYRLSPQSVANDICFKLAQADALVMASGQRAVIGSPEMLACVAKAQKALESGATREQAAAEAQKAALTGGSGKYLIYGLIGAAVLVGGAWYLSK